MKKELKKKLVLDRETVATLSPDALDAVHGGACTTSGLSGLTSAISRAVSQATRTSLVSDVANRATTFSTSPRSFAWSSSDSSFLSAISA